METEVNPFRFPLRRNKRFAQAIHLLLFGGGGNEIPLLPPPPLLLYDAFNAADFLLRVYVFAADRLLLIRHQLHMPCIIAFGKEKNGYF